MDAKFTIPYGEYEVADKLSNSISNISIFVPASRQEKGIDLLAYHFDGEKNNVVSIQVKQSRTYYKNKVIKVDDERVNIIGHLWFNRFDVPNNADWFILTGLRAFHPTNWQNANINSISWGSIMLAFKRDEMISFMDSVRLKSDVNRYDKSFAFAYDEEGNIYQTRGFGKNRNMNGYLLENRIEEIKDSIY